jgi:RNA:NAD 2'-phosphotransferase (TPT1/KptA family)
MAADGHVFRVSANGVWLAPAVPPAYLRPLTGDWPTEDRR